MDSAEIKEKNLPPEGISELNGCVQHLLAQDDPVLRDEFNGNLPQKAWVLVGILCKDEKREGLAGLKAVGCVSDEFRFTLLEQTQKEFETIVSLRIQNDWEQRPKKVIWSQHVPERFIERTGLCLNIILKKEELEENKFPRSRLHFYLVIGRLNQLVSTESANYAPPFGLSSKLFPSLIVSSTQQSLDGRTFFFIVQGEGRGHMTQAVSLGEFIERSGGRVVCVMVGTSPGREIPHFFRNAFGKRLTCFDTINFAKDIQDKSVDFWATCLGFIRNWRKYTRSLRTIRQLIEETKPDVVVNFYEILGAFASRNFGKKPQVVCIGHQYVFLHDQFTFPPRSWLRKLTLMFFTSLTAIGAHKKLALSLYPLKNLPDKNLFVLPPLLRKQFRNQEARREDFVLVYLLNSGYRKELMAWHVKHPDLKIHCFCDSPIKMSESGSNLVFHEISDSEFIDYLTRCKGLICTAGFESIAEAHYLNKPVCVVPVSGHIEQVVNAFDVQAHGLGLSDRSFDFDKFTAYIDDARIDNGSYRDWIGNEVNLVIGLLKGE